MNRRDLVPTFAVAAAVAMCILVGACTKSPNSEAKDLEGLLLELPVQSLQVPGGELLEEHSSPGRPGINNAEPDQKPYVLRTYSYAGDPGQVCEEIATQLEDEFEFSASCRFVNPRSDGGALFGGFLYCDDLRIDVEGQVKGPDFPDVDRPNPDTRQTVHLEVSTRYPLDGSVPPLPEDVDPIDCVPGST